MWPSTSAYTTFCPGAPNPENAFRNCSQFSAESASKNINPMPSCNVQRKAILRVSPGSNSVMIGPCRVVTTSSVTSGFPLTWIVSCRCRASSHPAGVLYCPCALNSSMKLSSTVGPTLVNPQPMRWLWPTITNGTPGSVTPATSKLLLFIVVPAVVVPAVVFRCAANHRFGIWWSRCISFDSRGFPETVCCPETTQLFDPGRRESSEYPTPEEYPAPEKYPAPEGRPSLAQRFSAGKSGTNDSSPGGTTEFARTRMSSLATCLPGCKVFVKPDPEDSPEISRPVPPSGSTSSSSSSSSLSLLCAAGSPSIRRTSTGGRSRQEEFTYRSAVSSGPSFARIFSRSSARW